MITTVGEAQIIVRANTAAVKADIAATDIDSGGALATKADAAGEDAGAALSSGFGRGAKDIGKDATKDAEKETGKIKGLWNDVGKKASSSLSNFGVPASLLSTNKIAALGIAAIGVAAVKLGSDMQKANASVAASEGISVKAATDVGNAFLDTGGKVEYSGIKQAQAFSQVAGELKATQGQALTTAQSMTFMSSATDLATASGEDLNSTTTTLAGVMQAFQLPVSESAKASQTLFNASRDTGVGLDSLSSSVERVKARLGDLSPPLQDLSALMVDLTNNGITGRGATTALQGAYTALAGAATGTSKTNETAKETLKEYGVAVTNAKGQLTPMSDIITKLAPKFATMTQQQQLQTATLIFGASAAKQMTAVIDAGTASYTKATTAVNQNNTVTKAAAINQDTLSGKIKVLGAAVSNDGTKLGSVLIPALTKVAGAILPVIDGVVNLVGWFAKGSTAAHLIEGAIAVVLAPALIRMGGTAVAQAARSVTAFVTMQKSATTTASTIATETGEIDASVTTIGTTTTETAGVVETETKAMGASFLALVNPISVAVAAAVLGRKQITDAINDISHSVFGTVNNSAQFQQQYDAAAAKDAKNPSKLSALNKDYSKAAKIFGFSFTPETKASIDANTKALGLNEGNAKELNAAAAGKDAYIAPPNTAAVKAATEAAKKAKDAAASAAKKAGEVAVKAQTTLTSEVLKALTEPVSVAANSLHDLGVPAKKAAALLKDAVLPFQEAVKALEAQGLSAADAVKIAEAGQKIVAAKTKAAAAAATKAASGVTATNSGGVLVNGVMVSGAVYDAAIGAAYKKQTAPPMVNIQPGAVVIHPAAGNDSASLLATEAMVNEALKELGLEVSRGVLSIGSVYA